MWDNNIERDKAFVEAILYMFLFCPMAFLLVIFIMKTIKTPPGSIPQKEFLRMIDDSYNLVVKGLTKTQQAELMALTEQ